MGLATDDTIFCSSLSMLCAISSKYTEKPEEKLKENKSVYVEDKCSQIFNGVKIVLAQGSK